MQGTNPPKELKPEAVQGCLRTKQHTQPEPGIKVVETPTISSQVYFSFQEKNQAEDGIS